MSSFKTIKWNSTATFWKNYILPHEAVQHEFSGIPNFLKHKTQECNPPTFVVKEPLHLHGRPRVSDAQHGAGNDALLSWGAVRGPHQAPVGLVVEPLQHFHSLTSAHRQLAAAAITGHEVVDHHCQLTATGELQAEQEKRWIAGQSRFTWHVWKLLHSYEQASYQVPLIIQEHHQNELEQIPASYKDYWLRNDNAHPGNVFSIFSNG